VKWLRWLISGLLPRSLWFNIRSVKVTFVVENVVFEQGLFRYVGFLVSVLFHQCSVLIFIYMLLLPEGQTAKSGNLERTVLCRKSGALGRKVPS